jgi:hypothetical protein
MLANYSVQSRWFCRCFWSFDLYNAVQITKRIVSMSYLRIGASRVARQTLRQDAFLLLSMERLQKVMR